MGPAGVGDERYVLLSEEIARHFVSGVLDEAQTMRPGVMAGIRLQHRDEGIGGLVRTGHHRELGLDPAFPVGQDVSGR
jgi:hypothetical protein